MQQIRPIETEYDGYRFRSRLEARWAVFFNAAGIRYEYEPEGFVGMFGAKYLPDFYFPDFGVYGEVKPSDEKLFEDSEKLGEVIDYNCSPISNGLIILGPIPNYEIDADYKPYPVHDMLYWNSGVCCKRIRFKMRRHGYPTELLDEEDTGGYETQKIPEIASVHAHFLDESTCGDKDAGIEYYAYKKARQARFEFGETPKGRRA